MTRRQRVDGHKFQDEFMTTVQRVGGSPNIIRRLHTPGAGRSGLTQPADFIMFGNYATYLETKETTSDRLSMSKLDQLEEIRTWSQIAKPFMQYYIVVNFISYKTIKVVAASEVLHLVAKGKQLVYNMNIGSSYNTLEQAVSEGVKRLW